MRQGAAARAGLTDAEIAAVRRHAIALRGWNAADAADHPGGGRIVRDGRDLRRGLDAAAGQCSIDGSGSIC